MSNDASRLQNDLQTVVELISPGIEKDKLALRIEEVLYRYHIEHRESQDLANDMEDKLKLFLSSKRLEGLSPKTLKDYQLELRLFFKYEPKAVVLIQTPDVRNYLASLENIQTSTMGKKLTVLKSFFGWMVKEEILLRDPTAKIRLPKKKKRLPKGLTIQELELVRETCNTKRERALIEVFYSTGCRLSELASMNIDSIDKQEMSTTVIGKGNKERKVYLTFMALYHLESYLKERNDDCEAVFITQRRPYRRMGNKAIQVEVDHIEQRVGLKNKKLTCHTMRHTLAQNMLDNGAKLEEVQNILGHENIGTTQIYAQVSEERKQQAHKRYA
ncbi:integrase/recombinase XerD [Psychrobacillus insolitus]|uniref:Integrase/recombinase XerD n=1 Tax=Psychrobacillus insolitus TaxID=1461 RepID=A0A2W7MM95_9BACI|nr:tyrosine-type recombinase/integrase [Psychrobacillus insolitus]PZX07890.1 integrase/recombinase XerD [Psychrobacillus insolitus]